MSTKFFNNTWGNTLFQKLLGIAQNMLSFDRFLAVVGFFRSSGYFKLRRELDGVKEIKILVGINVDDMFLRHNKALLWMGDPDGAKKEYEKAFIDDVLSANYSQEVEEGVLQMFQDIKEERLQLRIHSTKNLHAKFYLCLPENHSENTDGWVIMGSSNISDSGLGVSLTPRYELNVAMKDFDDVDFCHDEFKRLWNEGIPLSLDDMEEIKGKTYLGYQPTPYELYMKVLIDTFGNQVEDDFDIQLPDGVMPLKYQTDAVIQGYQMLLKHNGLFLSDVVGLGKTVIATMIAKRFVEANGKNTTILVVYPPALEENWRQTFQTFGISKKAQFVTNGSLDKILNERDQYKDKEEFDLVIVDEAHGFRSDNTGKFDQLQKICKSECRNLGLLKCVRKKVMLLSATPLNNRPEDLLNQLLLFQDSAACTIDGIPNLKTFFTPFIEDYKKLMRERHRENVTDLVDRLYAEIRERVIDKVTIRRTRNNILNDVDYKNDIQAQGIKFPNILPPNGLVYQMDSDTSLRFYQTLSILSGGSMMGDVLHDTDIEHDIDFDHLSYARYRAIEFLKNSEHKRRYKNADHVARSLASIYRTHMVKRLESSFFAFKKSLKTLLRNTEDMIRMFEEDKVIVAPDLKVKDLQAKGMELDEILEIALEKGFEPDEILYKAADFEPKFLKMLLNDRDILQRLNDDWEQEQDDPKFDLFREQLSSDLLDKKINPTGKLVLFSESVDTLNYLHGRLTGDLGRRDVLKITAKNRNEKKLVIKENFDANCRVKKDDFNIILTSDVLAEGVNLHRSNVIVNYDSPWNATRLMQRIGRVNRIGSVADNIHNFMFYPSVEGDRQIQLYKNALLKLQSFHSAFGEDAQIFSREEIVKQFKMFDNRVKDSVDKKIALLREVRDLYNHNRKLYHKIKSLPMKSRVMRATGKHSGKTLVFVQSDVKTEFYCATDNKVSPIDFLDAMRYLRADKEEKACGFPKEDRHYLHVNKALSLFSEEYLQASNTNTAVRKDLDKTSLEARSFLRKVKQVMADNEALKAKCDRLTAVVEQGKYNQLPKSLKALSREYQDNNLKLRNELGKVMAEIDALIAEYAKDSLKTERPTRSNNHPKIVISESFL